MANIETGLGKATCDIIPTVTRGDVHALLSIMHIRLGENNFLKWSFQMQSTLTDLFGFFDGSILPPPRFVITDTGGCTPEESEDYKRWKKSDMALMGLLLGSLEEDIVDVIIGCRTSRQAWLALEERFSVVSCVNVMQLKIELQNIRKGAESIEKYLGRVKGARDQLLSVGVTVPEEDVIVVILNGLPDEYSTARAIIE